jgi:hypothetical protein
MGYHLCIYGTNQDLRKKPEVKYKSKDFKELLRGLDGGISAPRSVFINSMFSSDDILYPITVRSGVDNHEIWCGYFSNKFNMITNFNKFSISKTNPFKNKKFYSIAVKNFLKRITLVLQDYKYYYYDDSEIFNLSKNPNNDKEILKLLRPKKDDANIALANTYWSFKNNDVMIYDKFFRTELENEYDPYKVQFIYYGDV